MRCICENAEMQFTERKESNGFYPIMGAILTQEIFLERDCVKWHHYSHGFTDSPGRGPPSLRAPRQRANLCPPKRNDRRPAFDAGQARPPVAGHPEFATSGPGRVGAASVRLPENVPPACGGQLAAFFCSSRLRIDGEVCPSL